MEQDLTRNSPLATEVQTEPKQSNFLVILLSILLIISCLIAGFFAYQTQKLVKELRVISEESKPTPTTTPTTSIVPKEPFETCVPLPECAYNSDPKKPYCKIGEKPPNGGVWCARPTKTTLPVACTMDAKICPDGSAVGRIGPKCEFAPCPTTSPQP